MSRRPPTPDQLESLRDTFRKHPPITPRDFKAAAVRAGTTEAAARRAYGRGWFGVEPIQAQLDGERARQQQSAEVLKAERLVDVLKTSAALLQAELRRVHPAVKALTDGLLTSLEDLGAMQPNEQIKALQRIAKFHKDVAAITSKSVELDRLLAGEATSIVGHKAVEPDAPVDLDRAKQTHQALGRAIARQEKAALLKAAVPAVPAISVGSAAVDDGSN